MHLEALSRLSTLLMNPEFMEGLLKAESKEAFLKVIDDAETARFGAEGERRRAKQRLKLLVKTQRQKKKMMKRKRSQPVRETADGVKSGYRVLAVTACPTGIAHTYMAAESLENMAKKLGISCKVETDGSAAPRMC